jgi:putative oxidoreductase
MKSLLLYPSYGIFIVRITTGAVFAVHGYQKFAGGIDRIASFFSKIGIPAPNLMAPFIGGLELIGGILLFLGVATRWMSVLFVCEMVVATVLVSIPARSWSAVELPLMLLAATLLLVLAGPGALAIWDGTSETDVAESTATFPPENPRASSS